MDYDYFPEVALSGADLLQKLADKLSDKRFAHVQAVSRAAVALAERWGYPDVQKAALAGLLHDYAKEEKDERFIALIHKYQLDSDLLNWGNNIWHGVVGTYVLREELGLEDSEILQAIARHTVGHEEMSLLDKIIYVADYIEDSRTFAGVDIARQLAYQDLDAAVAYETVRTVSYLASQAVQIYPQTILTYNAYVDKFHL